MVKHVKGIGSSRSIGRPSQVVPSHGYEFSIFAAQFGDVWRPNPIPKWPQDRRWLSRPGRWPHGCHWCEVFCGGRRQFQTQPCTGERCEGAAQRFQALCFKWKLGRDGWMMFNAWICVHVWFAPKLFWESCWNGLTVVASRSRLIFSACLQTYPPMVTRHMVYRNCILYIL